MLVGNQDWDPLDSTLTASTASVTPGLATAIWIVPHLSLLSSTRTSLLRGQGQLSCPNLFWPHRQAWHWWLFPFSKPRLSCLLWHHPLLVLGFCPASVFLFFFTKLHGPFYFSHSFNKLPNTHYVPGTGNLDTEYRVVNKTDEISILKFTFCWVPSPPSFMPGEPDLREPLIIKILRNNMTYS